MAISSRGGATDARRKVDQPSNGAAGLRGSLLISLNVLRIGRSSACTDAFEVNGGDNVCLLLLGVKGSVGSRGDNWGQDDCPLTGHPVDVTNPSEEEAAVKEGEASLRLLGVSCRRWAAFRHLDALTKGCRACRLSVSWAYACLTASGCSIERFGVKLRRRIPPENSLCTYAPPRVFPATNVCSSTSISTCWVQDANR